MTTQTTSDPADIELKRRHRAVWASGDYPAVAADLVWPLGDVLVKAAGIGPGQRVLDVAAGSGSVAIRAAKAGAEVIASDLTPELFDAGRHTAEQAGVTLEWREADAEALPFPDASFDAVLSAIGVMFAPHHQQAADELVRVCRPGGRIGVLSWTPAGFIGQLFATMKPFAPPPPPGSQPPPLWGDPGHLSNLFGDRVTELQLTTGAVSIEKFADRGDFRRYFTANYGPTIAVYRSLADRPDDVAALDTALDDLADRFTSADGLMQWEYLLAIGTRSAVA